MDSYEGPDRHGVEVFIAFKIAGSRVAQQPHVILQSSLAGSRHAAHGAAVLALLVGGGVTNILAHPLRCGAQALRDFRVLSDQVVRLAHIQREIVERLGQKCLLRGSLLPLIRGVIHCSAREDELPVRAADRL
jgi:hypothetical protein